MFVKLHELLEHNRVFGWIVLGTLALLLVPLLAMQFSTGVNWGPGDFLVAGLMLAGFGSLFVLVARRTPRRYRVLLAVAFGLVFVYLWAELAVGIFTDWGS